MAGPDMASPIDGRAEQGGLSRGPRGLGVIKAGCHGVHFKGNNDEAMARR